MNDENSDNIKSGIYCIENLINGKKYIGQSMNIRRRFIQHKNLLSKGKEHCILLQRAWDKYGKENFKFYVLEECDIFNLNHLEIQWIEVLQSHYIENGYNISFGGDSPMKNRCHDDKTKKKISETGLGRIPWNKGKTPSEETKLKMSASAKNRFPVRLGKHHSEISKKKMSEKHMGKILSDATKNRMSLARTGVKCGTRTTSKFVGVSKNKRALKWESYILIDGKRKYIGLFETEIEAAMAYNETALEFCGWKARLNVISDEEIYKIWND